MGDVCRDNGEGGKSLVRSRQDARGGQDQTLGIACSISSGAGKIKKKRA